MNTPNHMALVGTRKDEYGLSYLRFIHVANTAYEIKGFGSTQCLSAHYHSEQQSPQKRFNMNDSSFRNRRLVLGALCAYVELAQISPYAMCTGGSLFLSSRPLFGNARNKDPQDSVPVDFWGSCLLLAPIRKKLTHIQPNRLVKVLASL
jgi:hypothetical protein